MDDTDLSLDRILALRRSAADRIAEDIDEPMVKLVVFVLGDDWFAFRGDRIREVLKDCRVYFLPGCPPTLEGVINVRGDIESVLRLRAVLHYPPASDDTDLGSRILLAQGAGVRSGIRVDRVEEVLDVVESAIQPPPHTVPEPLRPIVLGVTVFAGRPVTVLDVDRIFADYTQRV